MDNLEEYIRKHREEMDLRRPPAGIWNRIVKELHTSGHKRYWWISVAAMVAVVIGSAMILLFPGSKLSQMITGSAGHRTILLGNAQLKETEIYYNNLANTLYREATPMLVKNPEIEKELFQDISQIDSICREIKKDLKDNVANQEVIEALIQNYRIKIRILEDILQTLRENDDNKGKNKGHEL